MFRKLLKNKKAQNTAEYAILISLVVAGIIAMQTYAQRALQARVRDSAALMTDTVDTSWTLPGGGTISMNATKQYEPYYLASEYTINSDQNTTERQDADTVSFKEDSSRLRTSGGYQESSYNADMFGTGF